MIKLQLERERKQYSRELMAEKLSISFYTYKSYEIGSRKVSVARLKEIAKILDTTIDKLI